MYATLFGNGINVILNYLGSGTHVFKLIITPFIFENYKLDDFHYRLENIVKVFLIVVVITLVFS